MAFNSSEHAHTLAHSLVKYALQLSPSALLRLLTLSSSAGNCLLSHTLQSKFQRQQQQCHSICVPGTEHLSLRNTRRSWLDVPRAWHIMWLPLGSFPAVSQSLSLSLPIASWSIKGETVKSSECHVANVQTVGGAHKIIVENHNASISNLYR